MQLIDNIKGNYKFLTGIAPYSSGVVAMSGYEIKHVTFHNPLPYQDGFGVIDQHLAAQGRPRHALCAIVLRSPKPVPFDGFAEFNAQYQSILMEWELLVDNMNPIARTKVAPAVKQPNDVVLYGFSYTLPSDAHGLPPTFIVAGAGDLIEGNLIQDAVIRPNETTVDAIQEKAAYVMSMMGARLSGLKVDWADVTTVDIYTIFGLQPFLESTILTPLQSSALHGVHWFYSQPPISGLDFEMDMRGIRHEIRLI